MAFEICRCGAENRRTIGAVADHYVAALAQQIADRIRLVIVVDSKPLNLAIARRCFVQATDGASTILGVVHGLILIERDAKIALQIVLSVGSFEPGEFYRVSKHNTQKWLRKVK